MSSALKEKKENLLAEIAKLEEDRETLSGASKAKLTNKINAVKEKLALVETKLEEASSNAEKEEKPSDMLVVVNVSNYMKVDPIEKTRFSPNVEVPAKRTGWITSQIEAGLFNEITK